MIRPQEIVCLHVFPNSLIQDVDALLATNSEKFPNILKVYDWSLNIRKNYLIYKFETYIFGKIT